MYQNYYRHELSDLSVDDVLRNYGQPVPEKGRMRLSPFRNESHPSLSVKGNLWYDFGSGEHGDSISLIMKLESCNFKEAAKIARGLMGDYIITPRCNYAAYPKKEEDKPKKESSLIITNVADKITKNSLLNYAASRGISPQTLEGKVSQVSFRFPSNPQTEYTAIGFKNNSGGWELRSKTTKVCSDKDITTIEGDSKSLFIFEGFFNYLSYVELLKGQGQELKGKVIVLNGVAQAAKAEMDVFVSKKVVCLTDNDKAGADCAKTIKKFQDPEDSETKFLTWEDVFVKDREKFAKGTDINDYLMRLKGLL